MKLTKLQLKQIIKEEIKAIEEQPVTAGGLDPVVEVLLEAGGAIKLKNILEEGFPLCVLDPDGLVDAIAHSGAVQVGACPETPPANT